MAYRLWIYPLWHGSGAAHTVIANEVRARLARGSWRYRTITGPGRHLGSRYGYIVDYVYKIVRSIGLIRPGLGGGRSAEERIAGQARIAKIPAIAGQRSRRGHMRR